MELAEKLIKQHGARVGQRQSWDTRWDAVARWIEPKDAFIQNKSTPATNVTRYHIHDTHGIFASNILAQGHMSFVTPINERWFNLDPDPIYGDSDAVKGWYKTCGEIMHTAIQQSNFYSEIQSFYIDRSKRGTGAILIKKGKNTDLNFRYLPLGSYTVSEDEERNIDLVSYEFELSATDAVKWFGEENLGDKVRTAYEKEKEEGESGSKFKFIHLVEPRLERDDTKEDDINMPFASYYICEADKKIVQEGGFETFPFCVSRYQRYQDETWGYTPAFDALPNVISANYIKMLVKMLGEIAVNPRILKLAGEKAQFDLRAGGVSTVSDKSARMQMPREWGTSGRFDSAEYLLEQEHNQIDDFFMVGLFQMFSQIDKEMTATEIGAREREKLLMFAPSFTQLVQDMRPMMIRIFTILANAGRFPEPPEEMRANAEGNELSIADPQVSYISKVALAIKQLESESFDRVMARVLPLIEVKPEVLDNFNFDKMLRDLARNEGLPERWLVKLEEMQKMREEIRQAQEQQAQLEQAQIATQSAKNMGVDAEQAQQLAG